MYNIVFLSILWYKNREFGIEGENMEYCGICGTKLIKKNLEHEGLIPFCPACNSYRFETYNCAVSMIVTTKSFDKVLLIEQYGQKRYILVAGYINKGESAEEACKRELYEEVGLKLDKVIFQRTEFHSKSNTLMLNYIVTVEDTNVKPNYEIDSYAWFSLEEGKNKIFLGSLAERFYLEFYEKVMHHEI